MARRRIPGLVLSVVADGKLVAARGYGAAQLDPWRAVDPERTVFRVASVSKVVTATAVMQLVEQRRLDLNRDVNAYLTRFQLPARHGPITLHHLLTHTAGFDERLTGMAARSPAEQDPLGFYLARAMPPTFIAPGRVLSYSNHGVALAGLLVEEVSGRPFADYVRENILEPLDMRSSGFTLSIDAQRERAVAYELAGEELRALPFDVLQIPPAGGFATTGTDMARFLIAHLQGGAFEGARILDAATVERMHAPQFRQHPDTSGWAYGFWEDRTASGRALLHNGGGAGYRALALSASRVRLRVFPRLQPRRSRRVGRAAGGVHPQGARRVRPAAADIAAARPRRTFLRDSPEAIATSAARGRRARSSSR